MMQGTVFTDKIVTATDLSRHSREVLDQALEHCITVVRNDQSFALLRRDRAAGMMATLARLEVTTDLLTTILRVASGERIESAHPYEWVSAFSLEDLKALGAELSAATLRARSGEITWEEFDAAVHEWQESAWAARSSTLRAAFESEADEAPLTVPQPVPERQ
jgi:hypothetical protein